MGIAALRQLRGEAESAFATENGSHSWNDIRGFDVTLTAEQVMHDEAVNRARITETLAQILGRKSQGSKLGFSTHLRGDGVALSGTATPADDTIQSLLALALGGTSSAAGSTAVAGGTTTSFDVALGEGVRFAAGKAILVEGTGSGGVNEQTVVQSVSTDTLTVSPALTGAPAGSANIWNSYTAYVDPSSTDTWQFQILGDDSADIWLALGCVGGITLANLLSIQDLPKITWDLLVTDWAKDSGTLAAGTYDGGDLLAVTDDMEIHYQTHGASTRNLISCSTLEVDPVITWTPLAARGNDDHQQVDRIRMTQVAPTAHFVADPSSAFWTAHTSQSDKTLVIMFGRTAGQSWCLEIPRARISAVPKRGAHGEQIATDVQLRAHEDTIGTTALARSPIRIHRL